MISNISRFGRQTFKAVRRRVLPRHDVAALRRRMPDVSEADRRTILAVRPCTMVSPERLYAFIEATRHVVRHDIPGAIVECGVWKGGAAMASIVTMQSMGKTDRDFYLYDTYEGMCEPTGHDRDFKGQPADSIFEEQRIDGRGSTWCRAEIEAVKRSVLWTGCDPRRIHFVKGKVEDTIPGTAPETIAVLRLDTDWYESTAHALEHLFPRLVQGGILLLDDYGHWLGARKAIDDYFAEHGIAMFLSRNDYTGRAGVKM